MIRKFKNKHQGETAILIGNGPSLKDVPLDFLKKYPSIGANKIFLLEDFVPTYYTIIDQYMIHSCAQVLTTGDWKPKAMFIRRGYPIPGSEQITCTVAPTFSKDIEEEVVMGGTVSYANLQILYYMGFATVLMVGIDHSYSSPIVKKTRPGHVMVGQGEDTDHFHPDYFSEGQLFAAPEATDPAYALANEVYKRDGRRIVNLTEGTKLDVIEKGKVSEWNSPNSSKTASP